MVVVMRTSVEGHGESTVDKGYRRGDDAVPDAAKRSGVIASLIGASSVRHHREYQAAGDDADEVSAVIRWLTSDNVLRHRWGYMTR